MFNTISSGFNNLTRSIKSQKRHLRNYIARNDQKIIKGLLISVVAIKILQNIEYYTTNKYDDCNGNPLYIRLKDMQPLFSFLSDTTCFLIDSLKPLLSEATEIATDTLNNSFSAFKTTVIDNPQFFDCYVNSLL